MKSYYILFFFASICAFTNAQSLLRRAEIAYEEENYEYSAKSYQKYFDKHEDASSEYILALANSYFFMNNFAKAEMYYEKVQLSDFDANACYYYGELLRMRERYADALLPLKQGLSNRSSRILKKQLALAAKSAQWAIDSLDVDNSCGISVSSSLLPLTGYSLGVLIAGDSLVFSSTKDAKQPLLFKSSVNSVVNLSYVTKSGDGFSEVSSYSGNLASATSTGAIELSSDQKTLYYTKEKEVHGELLLSIYQATYDDVTGDWIDEVEMSFCDDKSDYAHPALSLDGKTMYFSSNRRGTKGGMDIFKVKKTTKSWGKPINLTSLINTASNEIFPEISPKGQLSFASDGLPGYGGLDVFWVRAVDGAIVSVENAHKPVNSSYDDFAFVIDPADSLTSYLSTSRKFEGQYDELRQVNLNDKYLAFIEGRKITDDEEGILVPSENAVAEMEPGLDMIEEPVVVLYQGVINTTLIDVMLSKPLANASFVIKKSANDQILFSGNSDSDGKVTVDLDKFAINEFTPIDVVAESDNSDFAKYSLSLNSGKLKEYDMNNPIFVSPIMQKLDKVQHIVVANEETTRGAAFVFDDQELTREGQLYLDSWVDFLKKNPNTRIKLMTHTDSRGSVKYNFNLSQRRAFQAKRYLIAHGISHMRIVARGYGERYLSENCTQCDEEDHAQNRRIEIEVLID